MKWRPICEANEYESMLAIKKVGDVWETYFAIKSGGIWLEDDAYRPPRVIEGLTHFISLPDSWPDEEPLC